MGLGWFNALGDQEARRVLWGCCASSVWVGRVGAERPYGSVDEVLAGSDLAVSGMSVADLGEALAGHPRIGERVGGRSGEEQAGVVGDEVRRGLAEGNEEYERRFGHIYLVCASGRSGAELLEVLRGRLVNSEVAEWGVVRGELTKINRIRLEKLLGGAG
jgi:2-oxo-4-hydroxy-4-carboxy-5-ureidoimidazoline decarboxylase